MRKRTLLACIVIFTVLASASAQFRFELGVIAPVNAGLISGDGTDFGSMLDVIKTLGVMPIGNLGLFLESDTGFLKLGVGVKIHTLLLVSAAYPAIQAELALGSLFADLSLGGYYLAYYGIGNTFGALNTGILFPDASLWLGLGTTKRIRLGGGVIAAFPASFDLVEIPFIAYGGIKAVL